MFTQITTNKWDAYKVNVKSEAGTPAASLVIDVTPEDVTPSTPALQPAPVAPVVEEIPESDFPESDTLRRWFDALNIPAPQGDKDYPSEEASAYNYRVVVYRSSTWKKYTLYTESPQQKIRRSSLGTTWATGDSLDDLRSGLDRFLDDRERKETARRDRTAARKAARQNFVNPYKVGDFLYSSWGYDQTNREFYQVLAVRKTSIKVREVAQNRTRNGWDSGECSPVRDSFIDREPERWITLQIDANGRHSVPSPIHGNLYSWDGKPVYFSDGR